MAHLPVNRGFDTHLGFLGGAQYYNGTVPTTPSTDDQCPCEPDRWNGTAPLRRNTEYSTTLFGQTALGIIEAHDRSRPLFVFLAWQAVHDPYDTVPGWDGATYPGMLWATDVNVSAVTVLAGFHCTRART